MITHVKNEFGEYHVYGKSTEDKPVGIYPGNSIFEEVDTGDKFYYDELAKEWKPSPAAE